MLASNPVMKLKILCVRSNKKNNAFCTKFNERWRAFCFCGSVERRGAGAVRAAMRRTGVPGALHKHQRRVMRGAAAILPCIKWRNSIFGWLRRHSLHRVAANQQEEFAHRRVLRQRLRRRRLHSLALSPAQYRRRWEKRASGGGGGGGGISPPWRRAITSPQSVLIISAVKRNIIGEKIFYTRTPPARPAASSR